MAYDDSAVDWGKLSHDPHTYERMVSVLLSNLHPRARRTDGAGGDGGKDVWFPTAVGPEIFELKSFTERVKPVRRRQIKRSLARAAQLHPSSWHLVLPIDFNLAEESWFAELTAPYSFYCDYLGLTWLDARMAELPNVPRYFLQGGAAKVAELVVEMRQEQADLSGGIPDLVVRLERLAQRADEIDPYYRFSFAVDAKGVVNISLEPRYVGAETDRPITVTPSFAFPTTPEGKEAYKALSDAIRFGLAAVIPPEFVTGVLIDAPAGMGGEKGSSEITLAGNLITGPEFQIVMVLLDPQGGRLASLPITIGPRTVGAGGLEAIGTDPGRCMSCRIRMDMQSQQLNFSYETTLPPDCLPAMALPSARFLAQYGAPNLIQLEMADGSPLTPPTSLTNTPPVEPEFVDFIRAFDRLQAHSQCYFNLPSSLTERDLQELTEADMLIRGETVPLHWTRSTMTMDVGPFVDLITESGIDILSGAAFTQLAVADYAAVIGDRTIPIGQCTRHLFSAVLENRDPVRQAYAADPTQKIEIVLRPGSSDEGTVRLGGLLAPRITGS